MAIPETYVEQEYNKSHSRFQRGQKLFRDYLLQWTFAIGVQKRPGRRNYIQSHAFDSQEAQREISPEKVKAYYDKNPNLLRPKIRLSEIAFSPRGSLSPCSQQARKWWQNLKRRSFQKLASIMVKVLSGIKLGTGE